MTTRQLAACFAMAGICAHPTSDNHTYVELAQQAVIQADALLDELAKSTPAKIRQTMRELYDED